MNFLTSEQLIEYNKAISDMYSLEHGVINRDILGSISELPGRTVFGNEIFPTIYDKSAGIMEAIVRFHPFFDGNKRTSLLSVFEFLFKNGHLFVIPLGAPGFIVKIARTQTQTEKKNSALIKKISKRIEAHSAQKMT